MSYHYKMLVSAVVFVVSMTLTTIGVLEFFLLWLR